jgi:hypothetical protein
MKPFRDVAGVDKPAGPGSQAAPVVIGSGRQNGCQRLSIGLRHVYPDDPRGRRSGSAGRWIKADIDLPRMLGSIGVLPECVAQQFHVICPR